MRPGRADGETVITKRRGHKRVAVVEAADLSSLRDTVFPLANPTNGIELLQAIQESREGRGMTTMTIEELKRRAGLKNEELPDPAILDA